MSEKKHDSKHDKKHKSDKKHKKHKSSPSPSPSPSPPTISLGLFWIIRMSILLFVVLIFHFVFQDQCGSTYTGSGMMTRIMSEFSKHKISAILLFVLYLLSGVGSLLRNTVSEKGDKDKDDDKDKDKDKDDDKDDDKKEKSQRLQLGISELVIDMLTYFILVGILLNKCRSPLWMFVPGLIIGFMMIFLITMIVGSVVTTPS